MKELMEENFLRYASYVILERAIPRIDDGLKPVQRRILHTLFRMDDGKLHKVANVAGQTMAFHPHGDAAIIDALVNIANKGFLMDMQGNFGNLLTGDPAAAARYIETRLSPLAREVMFNPQLTPTIPSYDSRAMEPVYLPAKIPVLLLQGADGIAVGMSTHILPHNFNELLKAQIAILQGKTFKLYPDFPTGGILDPTDYDKGRGKVKLRVKIEERDPKTVVITEICFGTTTESLIRSIDEAAKRGKIKIEAINDYTAEKVEIEIKLPRGQYAEDLINALYAFTECEVTLNSQILVIKDNLPWETDVNTMLEYQTEKLQEYLKRELEIEADRLKEKIFNKTLEQIFIENRLYKKLETIKSNEVIHDTVAESLVPYHSKLLRVPTHDDREKLLNIPIRRISRFDLDKNQEEIAATEVLLKGIQKDLKDIPKYTINYLEDLLKRYGKDHPRKTKINKIEELDKRAIAEKTVRVGFDPEKGYVGTKVTGSHSFECSNFDKLLLMYRDGSYKVMNLPEKEYADQGKNKVVYAGVADKQTVMNAVYKDPETHYAYAKRFVISQFILEKLYRFFEDGMELLFLSTDVDPKVKVQFVPKVKQKVKNVDFAMKDVLVKGVGAKGVRIASRAVKKVSQA